MLILNDLHLGARRKAGTTLTSQEALRSFVFYEFEALLCSTSERHVLILGDLFDGFEVEPADMIWAFKILSEFLENGQTKLTLVAGNHDWHPRGDKVSTFHLLAHFLQHAYGSDRVGVIDHKDGLTKVEDRVWTIPHMPNQDLFDIELSRAMTERGDYLLLHANYDNNFAVEADHSLNVSAEVADQLIERGWTLLFAHEHQTKVAKGGRVLIPGNQIPTSVADCLGCNSKAYTVLDKSECQMVVWKMISDVFAEVEWHDLDNAPDKLFIRVTGTATAAMAADVVDAVARFRARSNAYVVTNAVRVEGMAEFDQLAEMNLEQITSFNVLEALLNELTEEEGKVVKELLA